MLVGSRLKKATGAMGSNKSEAADACIRRRPGDDQLATAAVAKGRIASTIQQRSKSLTPLRAVSWWVWRKNKADAGNGHCVSAVGWHVICAIQQFHV